MLTPYSLVLSISNSFSYFGSDMPCKPVVNLLPENSTLGVVIKSFGMKFRPNTPLPLMISQDLHIDTSWFERD